MERTKVTIAIDGCSSTGKSSFAKRIARAYGLLYLDSGALYRAVTLFAMENGFLHAGTLDESGLAGFLDDLNLHFATTADGSCHTFMGGRDVEGDIRTMAVSSNVSIVAAAATVRRYVDSILHELGRRGGVIMDGRDIGTTVLPDADLKIFMTADVAVRAQRRLAEMEAKGEKCSLEDVMRNLQERDRIDSSREISPLSKAEDAIVLDNTTLTFDDQMEWVGRILKEKFGVTPLQDR